MSTKIFIQSIIHLLLLTSFESSSFTTDCKIGTHAIYRDMIRKGIRSILYHHSNHSSHIAGGKKYSLRTSTGLLLRTFSKAISLIGGLGNIVLHAAVGAGEVIIQGQAVVGMQIKNNLTQKIFTLLDLSGLFRALRLGLAVEFQDDGTNSPSDAAPSSSPSSSSSVTVSNLVFSSVNHNSYKLKAIS